jgi:hypothetical protein
VEQLGGARRNRLYICFLRRFSFGPVLSLLSYLSLCLLNFSLTQEHTCKNNELSGGGAAAGAGAPPPEKKMFFFFEKKAFFLKSFFV